MPAYIHARTSALTTYCQAEQEAAPNGTMSRNRDATAASLHGLASSTAVDGPEVQMQLGSRAAPPTR